MVVLLPARTVFSSVPSEAPPILPSCQLLYLPSYFRSCFAELHDQIQWSQETVKVRGNSYKQPRLTALMGDEGLDYTYSSLTLRTSSWIPPVMEIKQELDALYSVNFNIVLCNYYRNGNDRIGLHADNEVDLDGSIIASVSFGSPRDFVVISKKGRSEVRSIRLHDGDLLVMGGEFQKYYLHEVPSEPGAGPRINLTFRVRREYVLSNRIYVFGSNLAGRHGLGSALIARQKHGAIYGHGEGRQGQSYAIPTKDHDLRPRSLDDIHVSVRLFIEYASQHPELEFDVVRIGCMNAGYKDADIAPMFAGAPLNCHLPEGWR